MTTSIGSPLGRAILSFGAEQAGPVEQFHKDCAAAGDGDPQDKTNRKRTTAGMTGRVEARIIINKAAAGVVDARKKKNATINNSPEGANTEMKTEHMTVITPNGARMGEKTDEGVEDMGGDRGMRRGASPAPSSTPTATDMLCGKTSLASVPPLPIANVISKIKYRREESGLRSLKLYFYVKHMKTRDTSPYIILNAIMPDREIPGCVLQNDVAVYNNKILNYFYQLGVQIRRRVRMNSPVRSCGGAEFGLLEPPGSGERAADALVHETEEDERKRAETDFSVNGQSFTGCVHVADGLRAGGLSFGLFLIKSGSALGVRSILTAGNVVLHADKPP